MPDTDTRPYRLCDSCGQVDQDPRHVYGVAPDQSPTQPNIEADAVKAAAAQGDDALAAILTQVRDASTQLKHMDCCAADGCPDGSCSAIHTATSGDTPIVGSKLTSDDGVVRGAELIDFLASGAVDDVGTKLNDQRVGAASAAGTTEEENPS